MATSNPWFQALILGGVTYFALETFRPVMVYEQKQEQTLTPLLVSGAVAAGWLVWSNKQSQNQISEFIPPPPPPIGMSLNI